MRSWFDNGEVRFLAREAERLAASFLDTVAGSEGLLKANDALLVVLQTEGAIGTLATFDRAFPRHCCVRAHLVGRAYASLTTAMSVRCHCYARRSKGSEPEWHSPFGLLGLADLIDAYERIAQELPSDLAERADSLRQAFEDDNAARAELAPIPPQAISNKVGRNEPCLCGSGKKFKKCCGSAQGGNARSSLVEVRKD
jgi:hypothetical protein